MGGVDTRGTGFSNDGFRTLNLELCKRGLQAVTPGADHDRNRAGSRRAAVTWMRVE